MSTTNVAITITAPATPGGTPTAETAPPTADIPYGTTDIIQWTITGATFPPTSGVVFAPDASCPAVWPGQQPTFVTSTQYQVDDTPPSNTPVTYSYTVTYIYNGVTYSYDPIVRNE